jgi:acetyl/propionyl-CoA carboxylase alpha subunit
VWAPSVAGVLETVLVLDRGVVGARVVRGVHAVGARAVTVHLDGGKGLGDESVLLGGPGSDTDVRKLVEAAGQAAADAVHPGCSPLAGSPRLAEAVVEAGLLWLGPPPADLGGTPVLPRERNEVQCLHGLAIDVRGVRDDVVVAGGATPAATSAPAGLVTLVDDLVVPHLTPEVVVTEAALGLDLVALQLRTAAGEDVPYELQPCAAVGVVLRGRGRVRRLRWPDGVQVESACREGADVPADGIVGVLTCTASTAAEAVVDLRRALERVVVEGPELRIPDLERIPA